MNQVINHLVLLFEMEYFSFWAMQVCLLATYNDSLGGVVSVCIRHSSSNNQQLKDAKWEKWQELVGCDGSLPYRRTQLFFLTEVLSSSFLLYFTYCTRKKKDWNCGMTTDRHIVITTPTNYHFKFKVSETFQRNWVWFLLGFFWLFSLVWCAHNFMTKTERHRALKRGSSAQDQGWCGYTIM